MTNERKHKMQFIFKQHPNVEEFYVTSDDQAFFNASDAKNHAKTLENKEVDTIKRRDVLKVESTESKAESTGDDERIALMAKLEALGGKAAKNIGLDKLKEKIAELEAGKVESTKSKVESTGGDESGADADKDGNPDESGAGEGAGE